MDLLTRPALFALGVALTALGVRHLVRVLTHMSNRDYHRPSMRSLTLADLRLAFFWIAGASMMTGLTGAGVPTVVVVVAGAAAAFALSFAAAFYGVLTSESEERHGLPGGTSAVAATPRAQRWMSRARRLPALSRLRAPSGPQRSSRGRRLISPYLNRTILLTSAVGLLYAGVGAGAFVRSTLEHHAAGGRSPAAEGASAVEPSATRASSDGRERPPTYAELCPAVPDPLTIGHGLGQLIYRQGAVQAGCAQHARRSGRDGSVWIAEGRCRHELRSVGLAAPGREPVLLYGAAARFAVAQGDDGQLLYAEAASPAGGDLYVVTTTAGSYVFARPTSSVRAGSEKALRCEDVDAVARDFAVLPPPLAGLWVEHMRRTDGWMWPLPNATDAGWSFAFVDLLGREIEAVARCRDGGRCELRAGDGQRWRGVGWRVVTVDELWPWMPPDE